MNHLIIYNQKLFGDDYIGLILDGVKTRDNKFLYRRTIPYERLAAGDVIYLKESSGPIRGRVMVENVVHQALNGPDNVMEFLTPHYHELGIKDEAHLFRIWESQRDKLYVTNWTMINPQRANPATYIIKRDMRSWVAEYEPPINVLAAFE